MSSNINDILEKKALNKEDIKQRNFLSHSNQLISLNSENIEETAVTSLQRLMSNWDSSIQLRENELKNENDYSNLISQYWETYQKLKINIDASFAFIAGDILSKVRKKFFESEEKNFKIYLESKIPFSIRLAYDFMAISNNLSQFKNKKISMEKLRALLSVSRSGYDLSLLLPQVDKLDTKEILSFKKNESAGKSKINNTLKVAQIATTINSLEKQIYNLFNEKSEKKLSEKQLSLILLSKDRIESIKLLLEKNISCYLK